VRDVRTMDDILADSLSQQRFSMLLLASFAGLALVLAAVGIYSVLAYAVRRRVREIGIRMALGAQLGDVLRMIVLEGMRPTLIGVALGLAGALALGRVVSSLIYGVSAYDPATFAAVSALLAMVALVASVIPAYRATKVDPMRALREE
jgi:putative ABC transport system permease protein